MQRREHAGGDASWLLAFGSESPDPQLDRPLLELAERLLSAGEPAQSAAALLDHVVATYGFPRGLVLVLTERRLSSLASHGMAAEGTGTGSSPTVTRAIEDRRAQLLPLVTAELEPWLTRFLPEGCDVLIVPLAVDERPLGALVLQVPFVLRRPDGARVLRQVERAAALAAQALHRVQRLAHLTRLAATDDLTMIPNRRSALAALDRELARSVRRGEPLSLVLLDIDHFKKVNDVHGHPAGDEALRNVAASLSIACRDVDTAARYGGEEFLILLPDCATDECLAIAERLRSAVAAAPAVERLSASAGVATFPVHASDGEQLIKAADEALLEAKRAGRNRTVVCQKPSPATRPKRRRPAESAEPESGPADDAPPSA